LNIHWEMFSWEAFATLMTGILAVGAASWVGWNQLQLQKRQTRLIENDLKIQLLDKRIVCVEQMREISDSWSRNTSFSNEEWAKFYLLFRQAELLYPPRVTKKFDDTMKAIFRQKQNNNRSQQHYQKSEENEGDKYLDQAFAEEEKIMKLMPNLLDEIIDDTRIDAWK
jgi:hypothetical protein